MIDVDIGLQRGDFTLDVAFEAPGGAIGLFGRSGSGKSTVLAAVAGLLRPARGHIRVGGETLFDAATGRFVPCHRRRIGLVFQDAQLFPHLSVRTNLAYGRRFGARGRTPITMAAVVETLGIGALLDRRPASLSGGERQRVAIGRALLSAPRLLLMDEPLASLDGPRKREILPLIERIRDEFRVPVLYVSHAVDEIARIAAHVVVIEAGRVIRQGAPAIALAASGDHPSETRLEAVSILSGRVASHDQRYAVTLLDHPAGPIMLPGIHGTVGDPLRLVVRGADVSLAMEPPAGLSIRTMLAGTIKAIVTDEGPVARVDIALRGGEALAAFVTRRALDDLGLGEGRSILALVKAAAIAD
jgi:molybdate transport system ATP-binding protein